MKTRGARILPGRGQTQGCVLLVLNYLFGRNRFTIAAAIYQAPANKMRCIVPRHITDGNGWVTTFLSERRLYWLKNSLLSKCFVIFKIGASLKFLKV